MKTEPREDEGDLPLLSAEEERLVEAWAAGHNQTTCYKMAYGADGYAAASLAVRACRKFAEPKIQQHLRALQASGLAKTKLSLEDRLSAELAFAQRAENAGNFGAAGGANDRVNKLLGLYVDKVQDVTDRTDAHRTLEEIAAHAPELAASLAAANGIDWKPSQEQTRH